MVRTSAKSRLISAGTAIKSVIVCTPCRSTLSAAWKASVSGRRPMTSIRLLLDTIIKESTYCFSSARPSSAEFILFFPSKVNGFVTIPTVNAPSSFAIFANIGAAPVPVPPPSPVVINTISLPLMASRISFSFSWAARLPISGFAPAPRPLVTSRPRTILFSTGEIFSA